ncbi:MAG: hypothetical protein IKB04_09250 [Clostridia bacterium]|nr:hypothetical protein [Clostridia bacterium]MBR2407204.1 hypothetical protein [Clostridia bacterium]
MDEVKLEHRLSAVENRAKSNTHRLDDVEKKHGEMTELVQSVATIAQKQVDMDGDVQEIKQDVKGLLAVPNKRWNAAVEWLVKGTAGALAGALAALLLK